MTQDRLRQWKFHQRTVSLEGKYSGRTVKRLNSLAWNNPVEIMEHETEHFAITVDADPSLPSLPPELVSIIWGFCQLRPPRHYTAVLDLRRGLVSSQRTLSHRKSERKAICVAVERQPSCEGKAFIVEEADRFSGVLVEFKVHDCTGFPMFMSCGSTFAVHAHTNNRPCAQSTFETLPPCRTTIEECREAAKSPRKMLFHPFLEFSNSLQIGFEAAEDILIGSREKSFSIIQEPAMLVFDKPDSLPISFVGAYSDNEDFVLQNVYVAFDSLPSTMMKPAFSSASLEGATKSVAVLHTGNGDLPGTDHTLQEWTAERPRTMQTGN
ncbi:hypothetical protein DCS_08122 [Drechmeria coniospora]|uniref:Uncharacterized protein n=1 Tax=Drechmeria coniospora TaxID=98403 RepID=A0A151GGD7_DRECN|nr:hypothetical protein DCS_08122 [Drechmeria coniospora]KYK56155.1 hypothetical protein DCS_08122 [Drechmeria coniospora]